MENNILIVDDEEGIRYAYGRILDDAGFNTTAVSNGEDALALLEEKNFDAAIVDLVLKSSSGMSVLEYVKRTKLVLPVIIVTGQPSVESASEALRLEAFDYLVKPVKKRELERTIHKATAYKQLYDEKRSLELENERYRRNLEQLVNERTEQLLQANSELQKNVKASRLTEKNLRQSEQQLRHIFEHSPMGAALVSLDYLFREVNAELCRITGYSQLELLRMGLAHLIEPEDLPDFVEQLRMLEDQEKDLCRLDVRCVTRSGKNKLLRLWVRCIRDIEGNARFFLPLFEDMESRRHMREELGILKATLEQSGEGVLVCDALNKVIFANEAAAALCGKDRECFQQSSLRQLLDEAGMQRFQQEVVPQILQSGTWEGELTCVDGDGCQRTLNGCCHTLDVKLGGPGYYSVLFLNPAQESSVASSNSRAEA